MQESSTETIFVCYSYSFLQILLERNFYKNFNNYKILTCTNIDGHSELQIPKYNCLAPHPSYVSLFFTLTVPSFTLHQTVRCYLVMIHVNLSFSPCLIYFTCASTCRFSVVNISVLTEMTLSEITLCSFALFSFFIPSVHHQYICRSIN